MRWFSGKKRGSFVIFVTSRKCCSVKYYNLLILFLYRQSYFNKKSICHENYGRAVFIQEWKGFEGWNRLAKQQGDKGSMRGVILSLLCDHLLLVHPKQKEYPCIKSSPQLLIY
jgi:hypothetical protein